MSARSGFEDRILRVLHIAKTMPGTCARSACPRSPMAVIGSHRISRPRAAGVRHCGSLPRQLQNEDRTMPVRLSLGAHI